MSVMLRNLGGDESGAVLAEFAVIALPLFLTFFGFVQLGQMLTANLVMKHSAVVAARAAAVISNEHKTNPGDNGPNEDVTTAAALALGSWFANDSFSDLQVDVDDTSSTDDPYAPVNVTVSAQYSCRVPLGNRMICDLTTAKRRLMAKASFPHQGALYK